MNAFNTTPVFDYNPMLVLAVLFTLTLILILVLNQMKNKEQKRDEGKTACGFNRACPACHRLLKEEWNNCPFCGHKEENNV